MKTKLQTITAAVLLSMAATVQAGEAEDIAAFMINMNGLLCATVTDLNPLDQRNVYEVECVKYRGGNSRVTYILDMNTGAAWED